MLQNRDNSKRGNDRASWKPTGQGRTHCETSGDSRDENGNSQAFQQVHIHELAARTVAQGTVLRRVLNLVFMLCCHCLVIFNTCLTRGPHFHFSHWTPANCVAGSAYRSTPKIKVNNRVYI